jgi:hypothetical protein
MLVIHLIIYIFIPDVTVSVDVVPELIVPVLDRGWLAVLGIVVLEPVVPVVVSDVVSTAVAHNRSI